MARLTISLLGPFRVALDGEPVTSFESDKVRALLAYLAVETGRPHRRETLAGLLWPERPERSARHSLSQALSNLRRAIGSSDAPPPFFLVSQQTIQFNADSDHRLDATTVVTLLEDCKEHDHDDVETCDECLERLQEAVQLYRGDFLDGFSVADSPAFEEWAILQRERLHRLALDALSRLVGCYERRGELKHALQHARRWLELDPWQERAHRQVMRLLALDGQRGAALAQYEICRRTLAEELGVEPEEETQSLCERIRDGLPLEAVPPVALHNLPIAPIPFVGREEELAKIDSLLEDPACRLLTLVGPGGIGKTRLALEVARERISTYDHGVFFVSLAALKSTDGIVPTVAQAFGFSFYAEGEWQKQSSSQQQLLDYLRGKTMLLLMDNFEHLLDGADLLTEVLKTAPGIRVLVTSRARLNVQGEQHFPVRGMDVPDEDAAEETVQSSALQLFLDSARRVDPDFELTADNRAGVVHICRLVQGNPLGILLAAAWVDVLTPAEIVTQIAGEVGKGLDLLETNWRDVPERQRSMRVVFDHSWSLLAEQERQVFQALSVFRGGFTDEAARQVAGASLQELRSLVNKSMVQRGTEGRYGVHELVRQYAAEKLAQSPDGGEGVRDDHCAYYAAALHQLADDLKGALQQASLAEMDAEFENARAAWDWALEKGQLERLDQAVDGLCRFYEWRGRHQDGRTTCHAAAERLSGLQDVMCQRIVAKLLAWQGVFDRLLGNTELAYRSLQQSLALLERLDSVGQDARAEKAFVLLQMGAEQWVETNHEKAKTLCEQGLALYRELGDRWGIANGLEALGWAAETLGKYDEAIQALQKGLSIRQVLGDQRGTTNSLRRLGIVNVYQGQLEQGERLIRESIAVSQRTGNQVDVIDGFINLSSTMFYSGKFAEDILCLEEVLTISHDLGLRHSESLAISHMSLARIMLGSYEEGYTLAYRSLALAREAKDWYVLGHACCMLGCVALVREMYADAQQQFTEGAAAYREIGQSDGQGWALALWGYATRGLGDLDQAQQQLHAALQMGAEAGAFLPLLTALPGIALLLADQGEKERAMEIYALASRYPVIANSAWVEDVIGQHIAAVAATLPPDVAAAAQERGRACDLNVTVGELLKELEES